MSAISAVDLIALAKRSYSHRCICGWKQHLQERIASAISAVDLIALAKRSYDNRYPCE